MARKWSNLNLPGVLHYVTGNVVNRIPVFKQERCCLEFLIILKELLQEWPSKLISYVIMPDHFHLIVNPRDGDIQGFCGALKSLGAKKVVELTNDKTLCAREARQGRLDPSSLAREFQGFSTLERLDDLPEN